jgi:superoxide reductase
MIHDSRVPMMCCGKKMTALEAGTVEASKEKHIPVITVEGNLVTVTVGSAEHPMLEAHFIEWIALETTQGSQRKTLAPGQKPQAVFALADGEKAVAAWEHCNLHGLWKAEA